MGSKPTSEPFGVGDAVVVRADSPIFHGLEGVIVERKLNPTSRWYRVKLEGLQEPWASRGNPWFSHGGLELAP